MNIDDDLILGLTPEVITRNTIWTTLAGKEIAIKNLETDHLVNCITHIQRRKTSRQKDKDLIRVMTEELCTRSELAETLYEEDK